MAFDYDKNKGKHDNGHEWVAFSDLYLCLSTVFLFLFVVASLRTGTTSVQAQKEVQKLTREAEELRQQIKVYNGLSQDYVENDASTSEAEEYKQLMSKLDLLQDEANQESDALKKQARELTDKEKALNKYQAMVKAIIQRNMVSKTRIARRDEVLVEKREEIKEKDVAIGTLEQDVQEKRAELEDREKKIAAQTSELEKRMKQLRSSYKAQKISKKNFEAQQAKIRKETEQKVAALKEEREQIEGQLQQVAGSLSEKERALANTEANLAQKQAEAEKLASDLKNAGAAAQAQAAALRGQFAAEQAKARAAFEGELAKQRLSAAQREAAEAQYRSGVAAKEKALGDKISSLASKVQSTEGELAKAQETANARKKLAQQISANFARAGIKADVDAGTGDVILDFGNQYFDSGRANLKPSMQTQLQKAMPVYSASLFNDPKIASKIQGIEIVGFASPTYKGKVIDPNSLTAEDKKAVDYNLDLSYNRAKSIFDYTFNKMAFEHQRNLKPLVKVTGRSFLAEATKGQRLPANMSEKDFCKTYDCKKAQRVIIKFNLGD